MTVPPPPNQPPRPRRPAEDQPEDSLTSQLFINPAQRVSRPRPLGTGAPGAEPAHGSEGQQQPDLDDSDNESTQMLSLEELAQLAKDTHDDRIDGPREDAAARQGQAPYGSGSHSGTPLAQHPCGSGPQSAGPGTPQQAYLPVQQNAAAHQFPAQQPMSQQPNQAYGWAPPPGTGGYGGPGVAQGAYGSEAPGNGGKKSGIPPLAIAMFVIAFVAVLCVVGYIVVDQVNSARTSTPAAPPPAAAQSQESSEQPSAEEKSSSAQDVTMGTDPAVFYTPSGNISCRIDSQRAYCVIKQYDYSAPQAPSDCAAQDFGGLLVVDKETAGFSCENLPDPTGGQKLDYGKSLSRHGYECTSTESGVTCTNRSTNKGFSVARKAASSR